MMSLNGLTLDEIEKRTIVDALEKYNNNLSQVAQALGITRQSLYRRTEKNTISAYEAEMDVCSRALMVITAGVIFAMTMREVSLTMDRLHR